LDTTELEEQAERLEYEIAELMQKLQLKIAVYKDIKKEINDTRT